MEIILVRQEKCGAICGVLGLWYGGRGLGCLTEVKIRVVLIIASQGLLKIIRHTILFQIISY